MYNRTKQSQAEYFTIEEGFTNVPQKPNCRVCITSQMRKPVDLPLWIKHHREMGVSKFYIRLEDTPGWEEYLKAQPDVEYELGHSDKTGNNYSSVQGRQINWTNSCMKKSQDMDWCINIDADELLHGSLAILDTISQDKKCIKLENAEAVFDESQETCFESKKFLRCGKDAPCRAYVNGKGGGRVEHGVRQHGCHDFAYKGKVEEETTYKIPFNDLCVLHFDSCSFGSWAEKFKHLGNNKKDKIPFSYYNKSIDAAKKAYELYKKTTMQDINKFKKEHVFVLGE
jgi:hypothetical protein